MRRAEPVEPAVAPPKPRPKKRAVAAKQPQDEQASKKPASRKAAKQQPKAPSEKPAKKPPAKKAAAANQASTKAVEKPGAPVRSRPRLHWQSPAERAAKAMLRSLALLLLVLSVLELLMITLVPTPGAVAFSHPNAHPFAAIRLYLKLGTLQEQAFQIGGNLALGFALGFLLPQITPHLRGLIRVEAFTALFVVGIEAVQYFFVPGTPLTIDVLILTALGAALGYLPLGRMFGMRLHPNHLHWWQRRLADFAARRRGTAAG